jgi:hypothetical protein
MLPILGFNWLSISYIHGFWLELSMKEQGLVGRFIKLGHLHITFIEMLKYYSIVVLFIVSTSLVGCSDSKKTENQPDLANIVEISISGSQYFEATSNPAKFPIKKITNTDSLSIVLSSIASSKKIRISHPVYNTSIYMRLKDKSGRYMVLIFAKTEKYGIVFDNVYRGGLSSVNPYQNDFFEKYFR